ncbi:nucleoside triphosphate pyrophosphohydrolase [Bacillus pinisoli]|uniref:nucleoside triphosphate pyrophosphohydrolase n=1 Tax=Bacillus pinisoli TaxID=2901866 RepID=UPI001FF42CC8|nr:nucleoside triphosphate pyrophosphohydrolase [Bacillus pinisoli]
MHIYNKLVRDKIPEIMDISGEKYKTTTLTEQEYLKELLKKGYEELDELIKADNKEDTLEELADLLEIINAIAIYHGASLDEVNKIREKKANERGGFDEKVFLIEVSE